MLYGGRLSVVSGWWLVVGGWWLVLSCWEVDYCQLRLIIRDRRADPELGTLNPKL
jgi:hypothetical protein